MVSGVDNELVRFKYKKDIINCIEESWEYYGKEDEMRKVIKELKNVYKIASATKNAPKSEQEAKAFAFDRIKAYSDKAINGDINSLVLAEGIIDVVEQYDINRLSESGESK